MARPNVTHARRIAFVVNPRSHRVARKGSWLERAAGGVPVQSVLKAEDFDALPEQVNDLAKAGVTTFFVEGGDGTVSALLSACEALRNTFPEPPRFAVLPGGSTNLAYKNLGFRGPVFAAFERRLRAVFDGTSSRIDHCPALRVDCAAFAKPEIGFLLSTGSVARAMTYVQQNLHGDGHRGSLAVAQALMRFVSAPETYMDRDGKPVLRGSRASINGDSFAYDGVHGLAIMTSFPRLSLGVNPFWGREDGEIALTHATWPMPHIRRSLLEALLRKRPERLQQGGFTSHRTDRIALTVEDPIMIDGEAFDLAGTGEIAISLTEPIGFLR